MSYSINFKGAGLKRIFTLSSRRYSEDCKSELRKIVAKDTSALAMGIIHRPSLFVLSEGPPSPEMEKEILSLPFVKDIENHEQGEERPPPRHPVKDKLVNLLARAIY